MKVLVTGHHGYIGSVLAPFVAAAGHDVVGLDADYYEGCDFERSPVPFPSVGVDVRDVVAGDLEGVDAVVHLAALSNDPLGDLSPELTYDINLDGSIRLARAAREAGVRRFVFASSCSMYGASDAADVLDEHAPLRPLTAYAESKVRAEEALWELVDDGFCVVSMRNATVYGASPRLRLDIVLNNLAAWAQTTGSIRLLSDGTSWRPLVHVEDVARVATLLLTADEATIRGQAYNVGSAPQNYLVRDLAEVLAGVTGCEIELAADASSDPRSYRVDFTKLESTFPDLRLEWDAERGARELVDAYARVGLTKEIFDGRLYVRLRQLRHLLDGGALTDDLRWIAP
jgi:nucleoside-diphosphate-sugar epimerase